MRIFLYMSAFIIFIPHSYSNTIYTKCDGNWNDTNVWQGGSIPVAGDSIYVINNVRLTSDLYLVNNYLNVSSNAEICGLYSINVDAGSYVLVYGTIKNSTVNLNNYMIVYGTFYTNLFVSTGFLQVYGVLIVGWNGVCSPINPCFPPQAKFTVSDSSICEGSCMNFYDNSTNNPTSWHWQFNGAITSLSNSQNPQNICYPTSGHYSVELTVSNTLGSDTVISNIITVYPTFSFNNPQTICNGSSYFFNSHIYTSSGNYNDTLSTIHSCDSIIKTQLTVNPTYSLINHQSLCTGGSYNFNGHIYSITGNYYDSLTTVHGCDSILELSLAVYPIDTTLQSIAICQNSNYNFYGTTINSTGIYNHTLVSSHSCDSVIIANFTVKPSPVATASNDTSIIIGAPVQLNASGGVSYQWVPSTYLNYSNISNPVSTPLNNISYVVIVSDTNGCSAKDTVNIIVDGSTDLFVPTAFAPDGNQLNQILYVRGKGIKDIEFVIYDRWGEKVFETNDIKQGWDGTFKGAKLSTAVFVYYVKATYFSGENIEKKGDVTLIR